jgi:hypothetical protein
MAEPGSDFRRGERWIGGELQRHGLAIAVQNQPGKDQATADVAPAEFPLPQRLIEGDRTVEISNPKGREECFQAGAPFIG